MIYIGGYISVRLVFKVSRFFVSFWLRFFRCRERRSFGEEAGRSRVRFWFRFCRGGRFWVEFRIS